jgi:hypothetical protein
MGGRGGYFWTGPLVAGLGRSSVVIVNEQHGHARRRETTPLARRRVFTTSRSLPSLGQTNPFFGRGWGDFFGTGVLRLGVGGILPCHCHSGVSMDGSDSATAW